MSTDTSGSATTSGVRIDDVEGATRPVKHSFSINGHRTSVSLEQAFWDALKRAAQSRGLAVAALVARIDAVRGGAGLSSAIRVWLLADAGRPDHATDQANDQVQSPGDAPL